jgi:hypothetical protein
MENEAKTRVPFCERHRIALAFAIAIVAISCFRVGWAFAIYLQGRDARPPDVHQAEPHSPSASTSVRP